MRRLLILILAVILYGSLFPLRFEPVGDLGDAVRALLHGWPRRIARGDAVANLLLYMPLGFALATLLFRRAESRGGAAAAFALSTLIGAMLSFAIETTQFFIPERTVSLSDFVLNTGGTALGALLGAASRRTGGGAPRIADAFALLVALAFAADRLWPLIPALDVDNIKNALKPLLFAFSLSPLNVVRLGLGWFLFGVLIEHAFGLRLKAALFAGLVFALAAAAPLLLLGRSLSADTLAGAVVGLAVFALWRRGGETLRRLAPCGAAIALVLIVGLAPYRFESAARAFNAVPFTDFIGGTRAAAAQSIVLKSFLFGALVWTLAHARLPLGAITITAPAFLIGIGIAQRWLPGRSASITDATIALLMIFAMAALRAPRAPLAKTPRAASSG